MQSKRLYIVVMLVVAVVAVYFTKSKSDDIPVVAIANYGPHSSLQESIDGLKEELKKEGFVEGKDIVYKIDDVSFNQALIPQMIAKLQSYHPKVMVVMTTPVAQFAKGSEQTIPLIYNVVTDPLEAKLIKNSNNADGNMTGVSDKQNIPAMIDFAKTILPNAKTIGLLYATSESNDGALVKMLSHAAEEAGMMVELVPIDEARDIPVRMQVFKDKVDFIYVGTSGPIQPSLPAIVAEATKMGIPVLNSDKGAVYDTMVLASFGVNYHLIGMNTGKLVAAVLRGQDVSTLIPSDPLKEDHHAFISRKIAQQFKIKIPDQVNVTIVE